MKEYISKNTLIGEIVNTYPESVEVLMAKGMHSTGRMWHLTTYSETASWTECCKVQSCTSLLVKMLIRSANEMDREKA